MANKTDYPCIKCTKNVANDAIECSLCGRWAHRICAKLSKKKFNELGQTCKYWYCYECTELFPFHTLFDSELQNTLKYNITQHDRFNISLDDLNKTCTLHNDVDPDNNYYNVLNNDCKYLTSDELQIKSKQFKGFSIMHFNCRSMRTNFEAIKSLIQNVNMEIHVIAITESWLDSNDVDAEYDIDNFTILRQDRLNKKGGGVLLYVNKTLDHELVSEMTYSVNNLFECVTVEIKIKNCKNVVVSCMYRTPGGSVVDFNEEFKACVNKVKHDKILCVCGDFNINLLNCEHHLPTKEFLDITQSYGLLPMIDKPTRITLNSATLIDNIFSNAHVKSTSGIVIDDTISDHLPIYTCIELNVFVKQQVKVYFKLCRQLKGENIERLKAELRTTDWSNVIQSIDVNQSYNHFICKIRELFEKCCPLKQVKVNNKYKNKLWITTAIKTSIRKKKCLHKRFIKNRTPSNETKYKVYRNKLNSIIKASMKKYYNDLINANINDIKGTWSALNEIINKKKKSCSYPKYFVGENGKEYKGNKCIADQFNKFFVEIGPKLADKIEKVDSNINVLDTMGERNINSMFVKLVETEEVLNTMKQCKNKSSTDSDDLSMNIVKSIADSIVLPFTHVCNLSLTNGIFPDGMKTAKVIPLFKTGDAKCFNNYRPVSLLSQFSKIIEKLFYSRLNNFIENNDILSDSQYGFRKSRSTVTALIELLEEISDAIDKRKHTIGVFVDLSKAFDTINHNLLLNKLEHYGVRGIAHQFLTSYLKNRFQYVSYNNVKSELLEITCGVPQGSILGPLLFILYVNDIGNISSFLKFVLFADDTNIFASDSDIEILSNRINSELSKLNTWFKANKLSLNVKKTNFMLFTNRLRKSNINISINNTAINMVQSTKFLGVIIDSKLNWKEHIDVIKKKLSKCTGIIYKASVNLETNTLRYLYCSLFLPYINYCVEVWGSAAKCYLNKITVLQKRVVRILCKTDRYSHTAPLFKMLKILKFEDLVFVRIAITMYKAYNGQLPANVQCKFEFNRNITNYNLRNKCNFKTNYSRTCKKSRCLSVYGIKVFNELPTDIKDAVNIMHFKGQLKNMVFKKY